MFKFSWIDGGFRELVVVFRKHDKKTHFSSLGRKRAWQAERDVSSIEAYARKASDLREKLNKKRKTGGERAKSPVRTGGREASRSSSIEIISVRKSSRYS
jgi:hypothetical protein